MMTKMRMKGSSEIRMHERIAMNLANSPAVRRMLRENPGLVWDKSAEEPEDVHKVGTIRLG